MLIYGKKCLTGTAFLAIQVEAPKSWEECKQILIDEFSYQLSSSELHELLSSTTKSKDESYLHYLLRMKEIASTGTMDDISIIQYVINGIPDRNENKTMLYGARNTKEFKEKLKIYETFKNNSSKSYSKPSTSNFEPTNKIKPSTSSNNDTQQKTKSSSRPYVKCDHCKKVGHNEGDCRQKHIFVTNASS